MNEARHRKRSPAPERSPAREPSDAAELQGGATAPAAAKTATGFIQLPRGATDYTTYSPADRQFGTPQTIATVSEVAKDFHAANPELKFSVGDLSLADGAKMPEHEAHRSGRNILLGSRDRHCPAPMQREAEQGRQSGKVSACGLRTQRMRSRAPAVPRAKGNTTLPVSARPLGGRSAAALLGCGGPARAGGVAEADRTTA